MLAEEVRDVDYVYSQENRRSARDAELGMRLSSSGRPYPAPYPSDQTSRSGHASSAQSSNSRNADIAVNLPYTHLYARYVR